MGKTISVFEELKEGWRHIYRSKKAHCFRDTISLCGKRTISDYEKGGLLHKSVFLDKNELCSKCLKMSK